MTMLRPRLRPGVGAGIDNDGLLRLIFFSDSRHVLFEAQPAVLDTLRELQHGLERAELLARVQALHQDFDLENLEEVLAALDAEGALEDADEAADELKPAESERFMRQIGFFYDVADGTQHPRSAQRALRASAAVVVGVGGTGTWMAQTLAMAGVGRLTLVDPDQVSRDNLTRQVLYATADVGRGKAAAAAERLTAIAGPDLEVRAVRAGLRSSKDIEEFIDGADLVVGCADEPDTNTVAAWISAACMPRGIPHIVGGAYAGHTGLIGPTIVPFHTPCWTCFSREAEERNAADRVTPLLEHRTRHNGAIAPLSAIVANFQAWDAIRVLSGIAPPALAGRLGELDLRTCELTWREVQRDPHCPDCGPRRAEGTVRDRKRQERETP